ncbi:MFS transporter, partial [Streptomyces sp. NPDC006617]
MSKKRPGGKSLPSAPSTATGRSPDREVPAPNRDPAPAPTPDPTPDPRRWWALAVIGLAQLMVILDGTVVNIALPS